MPHKPYISIVIVNYNSGDRLQKCLNHLKGQTFKNFEVIVIDNASEDDSTSGLSTDQLELKLIHSDENLGFAEGNNVAVKQAKGEWLSFLNPDAYARYDWLERFAEGHQRYPSIEAFGSTQLNAEDTNLIDGAGDVYHILGIPFRGFFGWGTDHLPEEGEVFAACGAAAFYKAQTFKDLGGFDERFFCYGEDVDLGFRLRLKGGRTIQLKDAIVEHEGSGVSGRHSDFTIYHGHRNRIWLAYKNTPFWLYWPFLPLHLALNIYLLIRSPFHGLTRPFLRGMMHGYFRLPKFYKDRKNTQSSRRVSVREILKAITWAPKKLSTREGRVWPYKNSGLEESKQE